MTPKVLGVIHPVLAVLATIVMALAWDALDAWLVGMAVLAVSLLLAGVTITGQILGILIDERNKISLSRLQALTWTVMILTAFLVVVVQNFDETDTDEPLAISIPEELLVVMGISATSLVASPLVKGLKQTTGADIEEATQTLGELQKGDRPAVTATEDDGAELASLGESNPATGNKEPTPSPELQPRGTDIVDDSGKVVAKGQIAVNPEPKEAKASDIFMGEETSNAATVDLGKIQMFYFTVALVLGYGLALGEVLDNGAPFDSFPALDESMVGLLGISHAAYLSNKTIKRTKTR